MDDIDPREQISRLEARIEELADAIESCRKFILLSRIAVGAGGFVIAAMILGAIGFNPLIMVAAIAAGLGGIVLLGSNQSTLEQSTTALKTAEAQRAELIGMIELRVVGEDGYTLH